MAPIQKPRPFGFLLNVIVERGCARIQECVYNMLDMKRTGAANFNVGSTLVLSVHDFEALDRYDRQVQCIRHCITC